MMGPCGVVAMLLLQDGQASPLNGTWELTRIFRAGPVPSTRAVPIDSTVYLRITLETHVGDWISGRLYGAIGASPIGAKSKPAHSGEKGGSSSGSRSRSRPGHARAPRPGSWATPCAS